MQPVRVRRGRAAFSSRRVRSESATTGATAPGLSSCPEGQHVPRLYDASGNAGVAAIIFIAGREIIISYFVDAACRSLERYSVLLLPPSLTLSASLRSPRESTFSHDANRE